MTTPYAGKGASTRRRYESLKQQYPLVFAFGDGPIRYLGHEESVGLPVAERIQSVWPFLVRQVVRFARSLRPRDLANYDLEDVLAELWVALAERDHKWDPARGKYLTFAGRVTANELHAIRDRSHTVHGPRNTGCRVKQYEADSEAGGLSARRRKTYDDILRVLGEQEGIDSDPVSYLAPDAAALAERRDDRALARDAIEAGLDVLTPSESRVIGQAFGLFGRTESTLEEIAEERGLSLGAVKKTKARALAKLAERLEDLAHPAAHPTATDDDD